jgi:hypothetical protein
MAKKKETEDSKKKGDLEDRVRNLRFENSDKRVAETIDAALRSEEPLLMADAYYHLGVNQKNKDHDMAIDYLTRAKKIWKKKGHYYARSAEKAMERLTDEKKQRDRPLWKKFIFPFRSAA